MKNQCFAYVRVSTVKQGEGVSLEAQREAIERYANQHKLTVTSWFEEKETAAKQGRPIFTDMVKALKAGKAQGLIMHKIDRSARNLRDWATVNELQDSGISVHFAAESVDFASRGGRLTADIQAVIAADYIRNLREETKKGIRGRLKQGIYPFNAPLGYLNNGAGQPKTICPEKGPLVRKLFELYASGSHSFKSLVTAANEIGLRGSKNNPIGQTLIENMLSNPFYVGLIWMKTENKTYQGKHEPLISLKTFDQVAAVREGRSVKKRVKHDHRFRRVFSCAECGNGFTAEIQKGRTYYRCHTKGCAALTHREDALEASLCSELRKLALVSINEAGLRQAIAQWTPLDAEKVNQGLIAAKLAEIEQMKDKLLDALLDQTIDKSTYETRHHRLLVQEKEVVKKQENRQRACSLKHKTLELFELFKNPYYTYSIANNVEKRRFLEILFSNRAVKGRKLVFSTRDWVIEVRNALSAQFGPALPDTFRSRHELQFSVWDEVEEAINNEWVDDFMTLVKKIHERVD